MSFKATNMTASLRAEERHRAADKHIARVTLPDGRIVTTNVGALRYHFQDIFTKEHGLISARFDAYLANFLRLEAIEAAGCEGFITEDEIWEALKQVGQDKAPGIDRLPHDLYLSQSPVFVPLLAIVFNNWCKNGSIHQYFSRAVIKLLRKTKEIRWD